MYRISFFRFDDVFCHLLLILTVQCFYTSSFPV
uniref:Uncharacterized protein n=1 Tax=Rhizophora mucronata TaxID=61149 RepID=A0A2P2NJJ7_RHIMU